MAREGGRGGGVRRKGMRERRWCEEEGMRERRWCEEEGEVV